MLRFLHCADIHLTRLEDRDYSLAVFQEIVELASARDAHALLISGDLFDSHADAQALVPVVRELVRDFEGDILFIPGNHEALRDKGLGLSAFDFGKIELFEDLPCSLIQRQYDGEVVEFLLIPHARSYDDFASWEVPAPGGIPRIALAHGVVEGMAYAGPDGEEGGTAIDPLLFTRFGVNYAALGHIHARRAVTSGNCRLSYPGSARVWRKGEADARGVLFLEVENAHPAPHIRVNFLDLPAAGRYRRVAVPVELDGSLPPNLHALDCSSQDVLELALSGVVEDEKFLARNCERLHSNLEARVRRLLIDRDQVAALPGIATQPLARDFLQIWEQEFASNPDMEQQLLRARSIFLDEMRQMLGGRR